MQQFRFKIIISIVSILFCLQNSCINKLDLPPNIKCSIDIPIKKPLPGLPVNESVTIGVKVLFSQYVDSIRLDVGEDSVIKSLRITNGILNEKIFTTDHTYKRTGLKTLKAFCYSSTGNIKSSEPKAIMVGMKPTFTTQGKTLQGSGPALLDKPFSLKASVTGTEIILFTWVKNNDTLGIHTETVQFTSLSNYHKGTYRCIIKSDWGHDTSAAYTLIPSDQATAPEIIVQPVDLGVTVGAKARFFIIAQGNDLQYQWLRNEQNLSDNANNSYYEINSPVKSDDNTRFSCIVSNKTGTKTSRTALLHVVDEDIAPRILEHPHSISVTQGQTARFVLLVEGTNLSYLWKKNGVDIDKQNSRVLEISEVKTSDNGAQLICIVSNSAGSVTSQTATLTVKNNAKPLIIQQPNDIKVSEDGKVTFSIKAEGDELHYQWQKNKSVIPDATQPEYTIIYAAQTDNESKFRCEVSNPMGSVMSEEATLKVTPTTQPPQIVNQPANTSVFEGDTASFSVTAIGGSELKYQWMCNAREISGATKKKYTTNPQRLVNDRDAYVCVISNNNGKVTSDTATVSMKMNWTLAFTDSLSSQKCGLCAAYNGSLFVVIFGTFGISEKGMYARTSTDGIHWEKYPITSISTMYTQSSSFIWTGDEFVLGACIQPEKNTYGWAVFSSKDGKQWNMQSDSTIGGKLTYGIQTILYNKNEYYSIFSCLDNTTILAKSPDKKVWTQIRTIDLQWRLFTIGSGYFGSRSFYWGYDSENKKASLISSTNETDWNEKIFSQSVSSGGFAVGWDGTKYHATMANEENDKENNVYISTDGITWNSDPTRLPFKISQFYYNGSWLLAAGVSGVAIALPNKHWFFQYLFPILSVAGDTNTLIASNYLGGIYTYKRPAHLPVQ